jgi:hypothetical protein
LPSLGKVLRKVRSKEILIILDMKVKDLCSLIEKQKLGSQLGVPGCCFVTSKQCKCDLSEKVPLCIELCQYNNAGFQNKL